MFKTFSIQFRAAQIQFLGFDASAPNVLLVNIFFLE